MNLIPSSTRRDGQAMIFVVMVVVILVFVALWNFDLHKAIFVKVRARDAGDAGALAAARWQGITLNLIGELNVAQAALLTDALARGDTEFPEAEALHELRTRLNFVGPMMGLVAANQAAKNNGIYVNSGYTSDLLEHAREVREEYFLQYAPPWVHPNPARTGWDDVADMLDAVAHNGLALYPDNMSLFLDYADRSHPLLIPDFYDAVGSRNWCWFLYNEFALLEQYRSWRDWAALPDLLRREPINSEIFSLRLAVLRTAARLPVLNPWSPVERIGDWADLAASLSGRNVQTQVVMLDVNWHIYHPTEWTDWSAFLSEGFPFQAPIRDSYNVVGADAAVRLAADISRRTPGMGQTAINRTAAAKPFGLLPGDERIDTYGMVLPGFTDVRLIPMDASTAPEGGAFPGWAEHITAHLPAYASRGPAALVPGCHYCNQLARWEDPAFRQSGRAWLELYAQTCHQPTGGSGPGGGTRRGH